MRLTPQRCTAKYIRECWSLATVSLAATCHPRPSIAAPTCTASLRFCKSPIQYSIIISNDMIIGPEPGQSVLFVTAVEALSECGFARILSFAPRLPRQTRFVKTRSSIPLSLRSCRPSLVRSTAFLNFDPVNGKLRTTPRYPLPRRKLLCIARAGWLQEASLCRSTRFRNSASALPGLATRSPMPPTAWKLVRPPNSARSDNIPQGGLPCR